MSMFSSIDDLRSSYRDVNFIAFRHMMMNVDLLAELSHDVDWTILIAPDIELHRAD